MVPAGIASADPLSVSSLVSRALRGLHQGSFRKIRANGGGTVSGLSGFFESTVHTVLTAKRKRRTMC